MSQVQSRSLAVRGSDCDSSPRLDPGGAGPAPLQPIHDLCDRGLFLQAFRLAERLGPLASWHGAPALLLAGRLAAELGAPRRGDAFYLRAARADPTSAAARLAAAEVLLERQGAASLFLRMREREEVSADDPAEVRAGWLVLRARVAAHFRDFEEAEKLCGRAESVAPACPATLVGRAEILEAEDRYEEALAAAAEASRCYPSSRPALMANASLLQILGRPDEACRLLSNAVAALESSVVVGRLAALLAELGRFRESLEMLDRCQAVAPLLDGPAWRWLAARRCEALSGRRDHEGARAQAMLAADPFHLAVAESLAKENGDDRRVLLDVPFVQQHHRTCSPATLSSISAFWGRPVDQAVVAREICYDGTPVHRSRAWAEANGWIVREFRVTWGSARALLDRGIPFAVMTAWTSAAHQQAIVGYDARRGTLLVRCPSHPFLQEFLADHFFWAYAWCGPRGTVVLPPDRAKELESLDLPDAELYDELHALKMHLVAHRRYEAGGVRRRMCGSSPGHALAEWASLELAWYDRDLEAERAPWEALLEIFPGAPALGAQLLRVRRALAPPEKSARWLTETCARHPYDLSLQSEWAAELSGEPSEQPRARRMALAILRSNHWPTEALNIHTLANVAGHEGHVDDELELRRLAARLEDKVEGYTGTYFEAAKGRGRAGEALPFLDWRASTFGHQSGAPVLTFVRALARSGRSDEALRALENGLALRPQDHGLALSAVQVLVEHGRLERAEELLRVTRGRTRRSDWHRVAAHVSSRRGDKRAALEAWNEVLAAEPAAIEAHQAMAKLLATTQGKEAALAHARTASARFPHDRGLRALRADWERRAGSRRPSPRPSIGGSERAEVSSGRREDSSTAPLHQGWLWALPGLLHWVFKATDPAVLLVLLGLLVSAALLAHCLARRHSRA